MRRKSATCMSLVLLVAVTPLLAQQDYADRKPFEEAKAKAEKGDAWAQLTIANAYLHGRGAKKDQVEAIRWYRKAAEQGHAEGEYNLGVCYANAQGVARDWAEAVKWYRKAAEQNHATAQNNLGVCYAYGQGLVKDYLEAYKWWLLGAAQGNDDAARGATSRERRMTQERVPEGH